MNIFLSIKRYLLILIGYVFSVIIAALGVTVATYVFDTPPEGAGMFIPFAGFAAIVTGLYLSIPSALLVAAAEHWQITSRWYYLGIGVCSGIALALVLRLAWWFPIAGAAVGMFSGLGYWVVAGRKAGRLKAPETAMAQVQLLLLLAVSVVLIAMAFMGFRL